MAYTPINWQTGDTITADKLNRCDNGWSVESTQLFSETVTTTDTGQGFAMGQVQYVFESTRPPEVTVTFNGTDYICAINAQNGYGELGASGPDFTNYPFYIAPSYNGTNIVTSTAGTYAVAMSTQSVEVSSDFSTATAAAAPKPLFVDGLTVTYNDCLTAFVAGREVYYTLTSDGLMVKYWLVGIDMTNLQLHFAYLGSSLTSIGIVSKSVSSPNDVVA